MKITGIETCVVIAIHRNWIFVKVVTDQPGLWGWGEATLEWKTRAVTGCIEDLAPFLVSEDPRRVEHLLRKMTRFSFWPLGTIGLTAVSAIEQALWDITGKELGVPVWRLLGGRVRDRVRVYTHFKRGRADERVSPKDIDGYVAGVVETVAMGYRAIKLGVVPYGHYDAPIPEVKHVAKLMRALREAVGDEVDLMFDFHGKCASVSAALAYIEALAPYRPLFVEEPIQPGDHAAMRMIRDRAGCPIATGERLVTVKEFFDLAQLHAVDIIQPDLCHCGGLLAGRKIAAIAEAAHMGVAPHNPMGPVCGAVVLNFDVATPSFVIQEEAVGVVPWFDEVARHPLVLEDGYWQVPTAPGLGVEIDEVAAARHPFAQEIIPATAAVDARDGTVVDW